ncbi:conjugal transfer protein [Pseudomonas protegens]|uniref:Conjugal transfer protein n=1 Tax=Pseudomonas protegens TaxID=380021 RepID=A0A2T6GBL0_9PSED|nr:VirB4 family type IV secretion system protein [Pseudomonas protegens]PUA41538.1 conjugal transfer protein [Pseudomonas protegens]
MVTLPGNRLLSLIRLKGISHETRDKTELNQLFSRLNRYFLAMGKKEGKHLMLQTYITKTRIELAGDYRVELPVLQEFVDAYSAPFRNGTYRQVGYSLALILKYRDLDEGIRRMRELHTLSQTMLSRYDPALMGIEEAAPNIFHSQIGRFYSLLLNGREQNVSLGDTRLGDAVIDSVTHFGEYDFVENRPNRGGRRFATTYDLRDYPSAGSRPGMWDEAIEQPFDFTLVQAFLFEDRNEVKRGFKKHSADLASVEGESEQTDELGEAARKIVQGEKAFGRYHASLIVYGDTPDEAIDNGARMESLFSTQDTTFVRSTLSNVDTWYTQFPAVTDVLYPMMKSTENLACSFSLHATPSGKAKGNPVGDGTALMPMSTLQDGLFLLNAHDSPPGQNNLGEKMPGHIAVTGMTGAGKTTVEAALLVFFSRWNPMFFGIDYNHSLENLLRALGTQYFSIEPGVPTGLNPFQLPDTPQLRQFLFDVVVTCAGGKKRDDGSGAVDEAEERQIQASIEAVMGHTNVAFRGLSLLLQNITPKGGNCLHTRLSRWCRLSGEGGRAGQNAWVLDSPRNLFDPAAFRRLAFDGTNILKKEYVSKHPEEMEVLLQTLFFMKRLMHQTQPGSLLVNFVAEYWVPLSFESTAEAIKEVLKAGRLRGETLMMDTQSPEDALATAYAPAVVQQVVTSIWLANDKADPVGYERFGIKGRVFEAIAEQERGDRQMVVVQGHQSVRLKMVLDDQLKYWLPLLSTDDQNAAVAARVRETLGTDDPKVWVRPFLDEMKRLQGELRAEKNLS